VAAHDAVAVIRHDDELHARVPAFRLPPLEHARELAVCVAPCLAGALVVNAELMRGVVGLADPEDRHVAEAPRELALEEEVDDELRAPEVGKFKRNARAEIFDELAALVVRNARHEVVHAGADVVGITVGVEVLKARAALRVGAVDAHGFAGGAETLAHGGNEQEPVLAAMAQHVLEVEAEEDAVGASHVAAPVAVGDEAVARRAKAREDAGMVDVGLGRKVRKVVRPRVVRGHEARERGHVGLDAVGAKAVEAHDHEADGGG